MPYGNSDRTKSIWAIATAQAKKGGAHGFQAGSRGDRARKRIAEAIDKRGTVKPKRYGFGK